MIELKPEKSDLNNELEERRSYSEMQFDKLIVYLSSGALVLSVGFIHEVINVKTASQKYILIISWVLFALSLFANLASHQTALWCSNCEYKEKLKSYKPKGRNKRSDFWNNWTISLNYLAISSLIFGVIAFIIFSSVNIY